MATVETKRERPTNGVWMGVFIGLGLRPLDWLLNHFFSPAVSFALAVLLITLLAYPIFLRGRPWYWSWQRNWGFWQYAVMAVVFSLVAFFVEIVFLSHR